MADRQIMVISVMAKDRPGIVAEVTEGISNLKGNLADLRESVLCGYFTMIFIAGFSESVQPETVEQVLAQATGCQIQVLPHEGAFMNSGNTASAYVLTAVGRDRVGLVAQVSRFCMDRNINILDLASHVEVDQYTMMLQIDLSQQEDIARFQQDLAEFGRKSGLNLVLQHEDIFRATNEV